MANETNGDGRPYIVYSLKENGTTPTFSEILGFYPVKDGSQNGTYEADTSKPRITLNPGMGDDGDVYYRYKNDVSGNIVETDTLPTHPTTDENGNPHSIKVGLILKNPNYRFVTTGTNWKPKETIILYVTCYEEGMNEVDMYLEGDDTPLETFDDRHEYEYTGEGIVPTKRDLTTLYTKGENTTHAIEKFTAHFHPVTTNSVFAGTHLKGVANTELTAEALKKIAPNELGTYSFVINGYDKNKKTYCYASRRYSIVKGMPKGEPTFATVNSNVALSEIKLKGSMKNAAGIEVIGTFTWNDGSQTVKQNVEYGWTFTPDDTTHYNAVKGKAVVWVSYYTLIFEENGGSEVKDVVIEHGKIVSEPTTTKDGYTFGGWYVDRDLTQKFDFSKPITEDMTLYAKWNKVDTETVEPVDPEKPDDKPTKAIITGLKRRKKV